MQPITEAEKAKFRKEVMLDHDMIQESRADDKVFQGDACLKWQIRAYMEWAGSPCLEHQNIQKLTHGQCKRCQRIAYEAIRS